MGKAAENLDGVSKKVDKVAREFKKALSDLQSQLESKGTLDEADTRAFDDLNAKLDELDSLHPDEENPTPTPADQVVDTVDTTGEIVSPDFSNTAEHIANEEPIPDPTEGQEDVPLDDSQQVPENEVPAAARDADEAATTRKAPVKKAAPKKDGPKK